VAGVPYLISEAVGAAVDPSYRWFDPPATLANPRYAGVLAWAGIDYYSAPNPVNAVAAAKNWRSMRTPGVLDVFRVPKPGASVYQSQIAPADRPVIIPAFWWDDASPPGANRSRPGTAGRVTLTATHAALGRAQVGLTVTSVRSKTFI
jgi:beta-galactosidase